MPKMEKARWVVTEVRNKMDIYVDARKVRAPKDMTLRFGQGPPLRIGKMKAGTEMAQSSLGAATFFASPIAPSLGGKQVMSGVAQQPQGSAQVAPVAGPPMGDDRMVDIDWVRVSSHDAYYLYRRKRSNANIRNSTNGTSCSHQTSIPGNSISSLRPLRARHSSFLRDFDERCFGLGGGV